MLTISEKIKFLFDENAGRQAAIATTDIEPGDVLLEEQPLFITPHSKNVQLKCANCCEDSFVMCKACQFFPLCIECSQHDQYECNFAKTLIQLKYSKDLLIKNFSIFGILKLLIKLENPINENLWLQLFDEISKNHFNIYEYNGTEMRQQYDNLIIKPFISTQLIKLFKKVEIVEDNDVLHKLCILMDFHAFEIISKIKGDFLKGIYIQAAKLSHNCVPNTVTAIDNEHNLKIYAAVPIKANCLVTTSYTNPLMGTSQRQHHLRLTRYINCKCLRCMDNTELGTHMSSMKCQNCKNGYATCQLTSTSPKPWICQQCFTIMDEKTVNDIVANADKEFVQMDLDNLMDCETMLHKYESNFHPNHFMILELKRNMSAILRKISMNPINQVDISILMRRLQLCEEFLPIARTVLPGYSKLYALTLYEYLLAFSDLINSEFNTKIITNEQYIIKLRKAKAVCEESEELLKFEPSNSPEGYLVKRISMQKQQIDENINKYMP